MGQGLTGAGVLWHIVARALLCCGLAAPALAQEIAPIPERRSVLTAGVDFYGSDLGPVFDTTLERCERLCLARPDCAAFTYNTRSNACFPKAGVSRAEPYAGAVSARIMETDPQVQARAAARAAALDALTPADVEAARTLAQEIGRRHPAGDETEEELLDAARARQQAGDIAGALRWTGAALARRDRVTHQQFARLRAMLLPSGAPQERVVSPFAYFAKFGVTPVLQRLRTLPESGAHDLPVDP